MRTNGLVSVLLSALALAVSACEGGEVAGEGLALPPEPTGTGGATSGVGGASTSGMSGTSGNSGSNGGNTASGGTGTGSSTGGSVSAEPPGDIAAVTRVARLTHRQYANTMRELFGITDDPSATFAPDALNGFSFDTSVDYGVDARLGPQYRVAAEELAERAVSDAAIFSRVVTCDAAQASCAGDFIRSFGERAFRRPLAETETPRFQALFDQGATLVGSGDAFRDGVRLVVEAMLQAPQFLYRTELSQVAGADGTIALGDWEIASRLSYFLWDSMPDAALFELARQGALHTPEQVAAAALDMFGDPLALSKAVSFHGQAWHFDRFAKISPDEETYPDAPDDMISRVGAASNRFVEEVVGTGGGLYEFLTAPYAFADSGLAPLYGASVSGELQRIDLDPAERKGFLMQVGFLASNAYAIRTDPIHRGLFVVRDVLCRFIDDPPPGASMTPLPETSEPIETTREEIELLTGQLACAGCHATINPPGFSFEGFDAVGQRRSEEDGTPVDSSGSMTLDGATIEFQGALELVDRLANSPEARACYASKWLEFAYGRKLVTSDDASKAALGASQSSVASLVQGIATTPAFLKRWPNQVGP